jgi:hypothetical protein
MLFVDGLKHNLLSVSQMCDKGCEVLFTAKDCKIKEVSSGKLVAKGVRTENNVYILKEGREECHLSKYDESWLWHRRLGHLHFDHLIKLRNRAAVRDFPEISKPHDIVCKPCQMGKLTRTQFKSKKNSIFKQTSSVSTYGSMWPIKKGRYRQIKLFHVGY